MDAIAESVVVAALREWADALRAQRPDVVRVGYFGSYASGDYVPGSDLDVIVELERSDVSHWSGRVAAMMPRGFPVPMDLFPYTTDELRRLEQDGAAFWRAVSKSLVWL